MALEKGENNTSLLSPGVCCHSGGGLTLFSLHPACCPLSSCSGVETAEKGRGCWRRQALYFHPREICTLPVPQSLFTAAHSSPLTLPTFLEHGVRATLMNNAQKSHRRHNEELNVALKLTITMCSASPNLLQVVKKILSYCNAIRGPQKLS